MVKKIALNLIATIAILVGVMSVSHAQSVTYQNYQGQPIGSFRAGMGIRCSVHNTSGQPEFYRIVCLTGSYPSKVGYVVAQGGSTPNGWYWSCNFQPSYYAYIAEVDEWISTGIWSGYWYPISAIYRS